MKTLRTLVLLAVAALVAAAPVAADLEDDLMEREKALWKAWGEKDGDAYRAETTEDYVQVVAGVGVMAGRETVAKAVESHDCNLASFSFSDAALRQPSPEIAFVTYVATQDTRCGGQPLPSKVGATSVWVLRDGKWMAYSYQETPLE
jgi:ketosteroid isomerase-like protein